MAVESGGSAGGRNISSWLSLDGPTYLSRMLTPDSRAAFTTRHDTWFGGHGLWNGLGIGNENMEAVANPLSHAPGAAHWQIHEGDGGLHTIRVSALPLRNPLSLAWLFLGNASYFLTRNSIGFPMSTSTLALDFTLPQLWLFNSPKDPVGSAEEVYKHQQIRLNGLNKLFGAAF